MKYIDADLLRKEIDKWVEAMADAVGDYSDGVRFALEHFTFVLDSLQQEQPRVDLVVELKHHLATTPKEQLEKEWKELEPWNNIGPTVQEFLYGKQPEVQNGKFVFPKYLYARTKDNKTIDMSYAPQDMTAIEYVRNDFVEQEDEVLPGIEEPGIPGKDFIPIEWVDACEMYGKWKIVKQEQPEVDIEKIIGQTYHDGSVADTDDMDRVTYENIARHFYELGLNTISNSKVIYETTISADKTIPVLPMKDVSDMGFNYGDKVIVQIRKK